MPTQYQYTSSLRLASSEIRNEEQLWHHSPNCFFGYAVLPTGDRGFTCRRKPKPHRRVSIRSLGLVKWH